MPASNLTRFALWTVAVMMDSAEFFYDLFVRRLTAEERERLWPVALKQYRGYADYQARSKGREIPLVILEPR